MQGHARNATAVHHVQNLNSLRRAPLLLICARPAAELSRSGKAHTVGLFAHRPNRSWFRRAACRNSTSPYESRRPSSTGYRRSGAYSGRASPQAFAESTAPERLTASVANVRSWPRAPIDMRRVDDCWCIAPIPNDYLTRRRTGITGTVCRASPELPAAAEPSRSRNGSPGAYIPLKVHVHRRGQITKSFALLHEVTVPRPREMIGQYWNSVFSEERGHFEPRLDRLLGIRIIEKFHAWILDQQHGMMRDVPYEAQRLTTRLHVQHGVPEHVAWRRDCRDAWQKFLLILEKYQSIPNRQ